MQQKDGAPESGRDEEKGRTIDRGDDRGDSADRLTGGYGGDPEGDEEESGERGA